MVLADLQIRRGVRRLPVAWALPDRAVPPAASTLHRLPPAERSDSLRRVAGGRFPERPPGGTPSGFSRPQAALARPPVDVGSHRWRQHHRASDHDGMVTVPRTVGSGALAVSLGGAVTHWINGPREVLDGLRSRASNP